MSDLTDFLLARIAEDEERWQMLGTVDSMRATADFLLTECEGKRRVVNECGYHREFSGDLTPASDELTLVLLHALATPYADHPDYRVEWKP